MKINLTFGGAFGLGTVDGSGMSTTEPTNDKTDVKNSCRSVAGNLRGGVKSLATVSIFFLSLMATPVRGDDEPLGIAELIHSVRAELIRSSQLLERKCAEAKQQCLTAKDVDGCSTEELRCKAGLFRTKEFELELNFVARKQSVAGGDIELLVVTIDAGVTYSAEKVQKIRLLFDANELGTPHAVAAGESIQRGFERPFMLQNFEEPATDNPT